MFSNLRTFDGDRSRVAMEVLWQDASVDGEGCSFCTGSKNPPSGASKSVAAPEKTARSDVPTLEGG